MNINTIKQVPFIIVLLLSLQSLFAQSFNAQVRDGAYVDLRWTGVDGETELWRQLPSQFAYSSLGVMTETRFRDTVPYSVCGDTIRYRLRYGLSQWLETAVWFVDGMPPEPTDIHLVTVDSLTDSIVVLWQASVSKDVDAYIVCTGSPCTSPDTVYETRYAVAYDSTPHLFRLFVVDSCGNPSAMSEPCNNMVLRVIADSCGGTVMASWNRYINMPGRISSYRLHYSFTKPYIWQLLDSTAQTSLRFPMPEGVIDSCYFRLSICSLVDASCAWSNTVAVSVDDTSNVECQGVHPGPVDAADAMFALPNAILYNQPPNDKFQPCPTGVLPQGVSGYRLDIYCRTGRRVFRTEDPSEPFMGRRDTHELQGGAYVYLIFYTIDGEQHVKKGQLLLLK